jgi:hypothetical protein
MREIFYLNSHGLVLKAPKSALKARREIFKRVSAG